MRTERRRLVGAFIKPESVLLQLLDLNVIETGRTRIVLKVESVAQGSC